jgi:hypothetical protein
VDIIHKHNIIITEITLFVTYISYEKTTSITSTKIIGGILELIGRSRDGKILFGSLNPLSSPTD